MATVRTSKRIDVFELHSLLGGELTDLSVTPKVVGTVTRTRTEVDEDGNETEVEYQVDILEGIPLDSEGEKEIIATVKGDGETLLTEDELKAAIEACSDAAIEEADKDTALASAIQKLRDLGLTDAEIEALRS